jgi:DNA invertase Pin-like site-specific DNA recombinase
MNHHKITEEHLGRAAFVYIRQSTLQQVRQNVESKRRQYALEDRARSLGFSEVIVVDDDLGISGGGHHERPGFSRLLAAVCNGEAGAVFAIEASRLARNNRDWHHLIDLCVLTRTLVVDADGIYDPGRLNDRLLLGMKGTMSEFELAILRQRAQEAYREKVLRGEVLTMVPLGYTRKGKTGIECVEWQLPHYQQLLRIVKNPVYAGAFAWGRTGSRSRVIDGRSRKTSGHRVPLDEWQVLLKDHHEAYISWDQYASDPSNRLVTAELEKRWNAALVRVAELEELLREEIRPQLQITEQQRNHLFSLGQNLHTLWNKATTPVELKKRLIRTALNEIVVDINHESGHIEMQVHWAGGAHTPVWVRKNRPGRNRNATDMDTIELVRELAKGWRDSEIASILNRAGLFTGKGNGWNETRVRNLRTENKIPVLTKAPERKWKTMSEASAELGVSVAIVSTMFPASLRLCDHLPLYRQEKIYEQRHGILLPRQTMCNWVEQTAGWLKLIYQEMHRQLFDWHPSRSHECLKSFIPEDYSGVIQSDANGAYQAYARQHPHEIILAGCWAHARRKIYDAYVIATPGSAESQRAAWLLRQIQNLYLNEAHLREIRAGPAQRQAVRQSQSRPITRRIHAALTRLKTTLRNRILPKSQLGKAIDYALRQWEALTVYIDDGRIGIDNNPVEPSKARQTGQSAARRATEGSQNAIRPTAIGKKNWLFIGSEEAGWRSAVIYSIIESCRSRGIDPHAYLSDVLTRLPSATNREDPQPDTSSLGRSTKSIPQHKSGVVVS